MYDILQDKELSQDNAGAGVAFFCTRMQADSEDEVRQLDLVVQQADS